MRLSKISFGCFLLIQRFRAQTSVRIPIPCDCPQRSLPFLNRPPAAPSTRILAKFLPSSMFFRITKKNKAKSLHHEVKVEEHKMDAGIIPIQDQKLRQMKLTRRDMESEKRRIRKELKEAQRNGIATPEMVSEAKFRIQSIEEWLESELLHRVRVMQSTLRR